MNDDCTSLGRMMFAREYQLEIYVGALSDPLAYFIVDLPPGDENDAHVAAIEWACKTSLIVVVVEK